MATYATDLTLVTDAESTDTWAEFTNMAQGDAASEGETDYYIQGASCASSDFNNKTGLHSSGVVVSDLFSSFTSGVTVFLVWHVILPGNAMNTFTNGGLRAIVGGSATAWSAWKVGGNDYGRNPYGGWQNYAVDPQQTADYTNSGGHGDAYTNIGAGANVLSAPSKGTQHGWDAIRYGRGEIYCTGTACDFDGMAQENDYNDVTNGYNRWGLFQEQGGVFLWKGLMSLGQSGTSTTFSDSNKTIIIDDTPAVYAGFNKVEIRHASSSITWTNITFLSLGTTSPGRFEMVENAATMAFAGCSFNSMDTFIFLSNAVLTACTWNGCGQITHGGADISACSFQGYEGTADTAYMLYAVSTDSSPNIDNCSFAKGTASTHAIEFDATNTPTTITLTGIDFTGYNATNGNTDSALYFPSTSKSYTVNLVGCTGDISYKVGSGGSVTLVVDPVTLTFTVKDGFDGSILSGARVLAWVTSGVNFPYQASVTITGTGTTATVTHTTHGLATNDYVIIEGASPDVYNGVYQITVTGASAYTYTTNETIGSSPATGTIIATYAMISDTTDGVGETSDSWSLSSNQPFSFRVRKSTSSPFFIGATGSDTILTTADKDISVQLTRDG